MIQNFVKFTKKWDVFERGVLYRTLTLKMLSFYLLCPPNLFKSCAKNNVIFNAL